MDNHNRVLALGSALIVAAASVMTGGTYTVPVPAGTAVSVHLVDPLSSSTASAGQSFEIVIAEPLVLQGWVVAQKGAAGQGHVIAASKATTGGHSPSVSVQLDWITAVNGQHIEIVATKGKTSPLVFGIAGPFAGNFQKGKEVAVGPDLVFPGYTSTDRVITVNAGP